jgi:hypothetical protein
MLIASLSMWVALSDERADLSFTEVIGSSTWHIYSFTCRHYTWSVMKNPVPYAYLLFTVLLTTLALVSVSSGAGDAIWSKSNFWPTCHRHFRSSPLPHVCTVPRASAIFEMHHGSRVLCSAPPVMGILPRSSKLCQNSVLSVSLSILEAEKSTGK